MNHTELPWETVEIEDDIEGLPITAVILTPNKAEIIKQRQMRYEGFDIAHCYGEDHEANAAFIVRACNSHDDLVAALEQMTAHYEHLDDGDGSIQQARAAIAKAKGEA